MSVSKDAADKGTAGKDGVDNDVDASEAPLIDHLTELRTRLLMSPGSFVCHLSGFCLGNIRLSANSLRARR